MSLTVGVLDEQRDGKRRDLGLDRLDEFVVHAENGHERLECQCAYLIARVLHGHFDQALGDLTQVGHQNLLLILVAQLFGKALLLLLCFNQFDLYSLSYF